ncbi:MAG: hypothetical protein F6K24_44855 [Okeania sp. SIO2D1]|uniref:hypothetical protein n=1 Tax=Okeania sp. SIO2C9 TaxID=2607791 RepID=UPI0013B8CBBD|nr:hypothetical protein [Okeania sp. SIO2C9]NEQ77252.1 hypothetical protein [Okeania sp. SIO2C9]NES71836.1 hypothetical protein [Okeania sp. SIO2D1]
MIFINPKTDFAFKKIFGSQQSKDIWWWCIVMVESVWGVREMGRWGDGEMGGWGDGECGRN